MLREKEEGKRISFRLNRETTKLYEEYRKLWKDQVKESQIFRAGLQYLMSITEVVSNEQVIKAQQEIDQIVDQMKERLEKHLDPKLYELWKKLQAKQKQFLKASEKSTEKFSSVVGDGIAGKKSDPNKKHTPGRIPDREKGHAD